MFDYGGVLDSMRCRIISFVIPHDEYCSDKAYRSRVQIHTKVALYPIGNFQRYTNWDVILEFVGHSITTLFFFKTSEFEFSA